MLICGLLCVHMNFLWRLFWCVCDAYNVYLRGVPYTSPNKKNWKKETTLPSVMTRTLGKEALFAECWAQHSANRPSLPSVWPLRHSAKSPSSLRSRCTYFILPRVVWALGKVFAECPMENTRQTLLCRVNSSRVLYSECNTWQSLFRVF